MLTLPLALDLLGSLGDALSFAFGMFWEILWALILGFALSGIVQAVGPYVTYVKSGGHVISCISIFCGNCEHCLTGHPNRCQNAAATISRKGSPMLRTIATAGATPHPLDRSFARLSRRWPQRAIFYLTVK